MKIDVETVVAMTVEKAKWTKILRFRAGGDRQSYISMMLKAIDEHLCRKKNMVTRENVSMTSLLTLNVAHSTRHSFRPKTNNQPIKKFLSLAFS